MQITESTAIHNTVEDDIAILNNSTLSIHGIVNGNIRTEQGCRLELYGIVNGTISSESGSHVAIHGVLNGTIHGSGNIDLFGVIRSDDPLPQNMVIHPRSIVNDHQY